MWKLKLDPITKLLYIAAMEPRDKEMFFENIYLGDRNLLLPIWVKWRIREGQLKELVKWMWLFFGLSREPIEFELDRDYLLQWLAFYEDLNEKETAKLSYAWWWRELTQLQWILGEVWLEDIKISKERHFLFFENSKFDISMFDNMTLRSLLSFVFWGAVLRWDFDIINDKLVNLKIFWPVYEDFKKKFLSKIRKMLGKEIILIRQYITKKGKNEIVQWSIDDEEVLKLFALWLKIDVNESNRLGDELRKDFDIPSEYKYIKTIKF